MVVSTPNSATERLALYQQFLSTGTGDIDVYQIDVIWPGLLGSYFVDLSAHIPADEIARHFPAIVENNTVGGELKAMPWFADVGLLYYRSDLLAEHGLDVPASWAGLADAAATIQAAERDAGNGETIRLEGRVREGVECYTLETPEGDVWSLVSGEVAFTAGDYVAVEGTRPDMSICMQGVGTVAVTSITEADPPARERDRETR